MPGLTSVPCAQWMRCSRVLVTYLDHRDEWVRLGLTPRFGLGHLALAVETWSWLRSFRRLQCFYVFGLNKIHDDLSTIFSLCIVTIVRWVASHHISLSELLVVRSFDNHKIQDQGKDRLAWT